MKTKISLAQRFDLLKELVRSGFKLRYNDSFLGVIWVVLKPLLSFLVLFFVFSKFKDLSIENFQVYLLTGIIVYNYFSESILSGTGSLLGMAHVILKVKFPREIAVLSSQALILINLFINLVILAFFGITTGVHTTFLSGLYAFYILFVLTMLSFGMTLFTSVMTVKLRDIQFILEVLLQLGFYLSPIFYPIKMIPVRFRPFIEYNPITIMIQAVRGAVISGEIINVRPVLYLTVGSLFIIAFGLLFFKKHVKKVAEFY